MAALALDLVHHRLQVFDVPAQRADPGALFRQQLRRPRPIPSPAPVISATRPSSCIPASPFCVAVPFQSRQGLREMRATGDA